MASRLPRSVPSAEHVDAAGISAFLDALDGVELHSLMVVRHGKVIAEGWWRPYREDEIQLGYSLSKSFTSVALSYALAEGLLRYDDLVLEVLDADAATVDARFASLTIRDLARMTTGHHVDPIGQHGWPPPEGEPGSVWIYNNWASWTLGRCVQKVTGRSLTAYLEPRLFEPLDIEDWAWTQEQGFQLGFSGLHLATESWAKFGHLLLRGGELWDRQVIDDGYLRAATRVQADTSASPDGSPRIVEPDWALGYGYQFWMSQHGFRGDGAYGQFVCVLPEQDMVLVTTSATEDMQAILTAAWDHLLPAVSVSRAADDSASRAADDSAGRAADEGGVSGLSAAGWAGRAADEGGLSGLSAAGWAGRAADEGGVSRPPAPADRALASRLAALTLPPLSSRAPDQAATFRAADEGNDAFASLRQLAASTDERTWELTLWLPDGPVHLNAGDGHWGTGELPGAEGGTMPVGASAGWCDDDTFEVELRSLQTPDGVRVVCNLTTGTFTSRWLTAPLGPTEFRQLALTPGLRHRG